MKEERERGQWTFFLLPYRWVALLFAAFAGVFALVFSLYDLEAEAVWYAAGLCLLLAVVVLGVQLARLGKRHGDYRKMLADLPLLPEELPEPRTLEEADLQEMVRRLRQMGEDSGNRWQARWRDSLDYYTTWVHQIKTPISVMRMTLEGEDTEEHRELSSQLFRIEQYVEMVLSYLRLESDSSDYVFQEYDLDSILRQAIRKYAPLFVRQRVRLVYEPVRRTVLTDEKWLLFIVEQILSNSLKYTRSGSVTITVSPDAVLRIADTGMGIAPEDLPRIFEKGFTGYNGRADKKSTGLGLYLCRMAAERLSHRIWAESQPGKGASVFLDLHREALEVE